MATAPRLAPTTEDDWDEETRELVLSNNGLNIFRTVAHHPKLLKRWLVFGRHVLAKSSLPPRERELAILRTGWRCGSEYEFGQHTVIGLGSGLSEDEIRNLTQDASSTGWSHEDETLIRAVDELVDDHRISDQTWSDLAGTWSKQQLLDLVFAVGQYTLVSSMLNTFGVEPEDGLPGFPAA